MHGGKIQAVKWADFAGSGCLKFGFAVTIRIACRTPVLICIFQRLSLAYFCPTMCFLPLKIPLWFWLPCSSLLKLLPRRELFSHSLGISTLTQCLEGWQAAGNCYQLSEMMSSSWKQEKSGIEEKTIWPVSCSLGRLGRSSVIRIQSGRSTSDSHTKSTFKETVFYSGVK